MYDIGDDKSKSIVQIKTEWFVRGIFQIYFIETISFENASVDNAWCDFNNRDINMNCSGFQRKNDLVKVCMSVRV